MARLCFEFCFRSALGPFFGSMTKKRKASSPLQPSPAPRTAAAAINVDPSREVAALREQVDKLQRRIEQLEDGAEQRERLRCLVFSGPAIPQPEQGEKTEELISDLLSTYMNFTMNLAEVEEAFRVRNMKVILVKFRAAGAGSDRDKLFRSKTKLHGTGLFVAESLTRKRQAMFKELLGLKKRKSIHAAFTQSGELFVRITAESAPLKIADQSAVEQLKETVPPPVQSRERPRAGESEPLVTASSVSPRASSAPAVTAPAPPSPERSLAAPLQPESAGVSRTLSLIHI